jgi:large subunit ribosomal protein L18
MGSETKKALKLRRRGLRFRSRVTGTAERPRLRVTRSLKHIYVQLIDDSAGHTLAATSSLALKMPGGNVAAARSVGRAIAEKAKACSITRARFDRGGRLYHGRVKALADAAREAGLEF